MTETKMHKLLKDIGMAFLYNQGCFLVATEVSVNPHGKRIDNILDRHFIIDICGIGEKYVPYTPFVERKNDYKYNVLRGIEVKVSKSDFLNGFVCSGCNYNYLIIPEGLIWTYQVPDGIGIITIELHMFEAKFHPFPLGKFEFKGLRILRKPKFKKIEQYQIDNAIANIAKMSTRRLIELLGEKLSQTKLLDVEGKREEKTR